MRDLVKKGELYMKMGASEVRAIRNWKLKV